MKGIELMKIGDDLYEIKKRISADRFKEPLTTENAEILKKWYKSEKLLIAKKTNEYLFVNQIEEAQIVNDLEN